MTRLNLQVPRNLWTLECSASPGEIYQPQTHPKGNSKLVKTEPGILSSHLEVMVWFSTIQHLLVLPEEWKSLLTSIPVLSCHEIMLPRKEMGTEKYIDSLGYTQK